MNQNYWEKYFDAGSIARSNALRQEIRIPSTGISTGPHPI